jgi:hypothetical protein
MLEGSSLVSAVLGSQLGTTLSDGYERRFDYLLRLTFYPGFRHIDSRFRQVRRYH